MTRADAGKSDAQASANPHQRRGLIPGIALVLHANPTLAEEGFPTTVEFVAADRVEVLVPIRQRRLRPLRSGITVEAHYHHGKRLRRFLAEVIGHSADGSHEILGTPRFIDDQERRGSYRLVTSIIPAVVERLPAADCDDPEAKPESIRGLVIDLSDGGLGLSSPARLQTGDRCHVVIDLGPPGQFDTTVEILGIEDAGDGHRNRRFHCRFVDLPRRDRDRVARFLIRKQVELRAMGRL